MTPFTESFIRMALASGAIVPPPGGGRSGSERLLAVAGWLVGLLGVLALGVAYWIGV